GTTCLVRYPGSPSGCTGTPSATSAAIRSIHGFTAATSTFGSVASCSSHAVAAVTNGLRGNATATPVDSFRPGAACDATAAFRYAVRPVSVNNRPENPACVRRAKPSTLPSDWGTVITSTCTVEHPAAPGACMGRRGVHHANRHPGQQLRCRGGCCRIGGIDLRAEKRSKTALMGVLEKAVPIATLVFVVSSMVAMGLGLKVAQITAPLRNLRLVSLSLLANFVLMPAAAVVLARVLRLDEPLGVGLLVLGVAAGAPFLPKLTQIAKGNLAFAVALMVLLMVITVGYLPLVLPVLLPGVSVNPAKIARSLVLLMLVPLAVALAVNAKLPAAAARAKPLFDRLSSLGLILVVVLLVVVNFNKVLSVFGTRAILAGLLFIAFGYAVGWALGGPAADTRPVLGLGTAQRNIAAALVVGGQSFSNPSVVVMVVVVAIVSLLILLPMSRLLARKACRGSGG